MSSAAGQGRKKIELKTCSLKRFSVSDILLKRNNQIPGERNFREGTIRRRATREYGADRPEVSNSRAFPGGKPGWEDKMEKYKPMDLVKEVVWNLFVYVLYYAYCFVMLLIVHFLLYRFIPAMQWTLKNIAVYALAAATVVMIVRIAGRICGRK